MKIAFLIQILVLANLSFCGQKIYPIKKNGQLRETHFIDQFQEMRSHPPNGSMTDEESGFKRFNSKAIGSIVLLDSLFEGNSNVSKKPLILLPVNGLFGDGDLELSQSKDDLDSKEKEIEKYISEEREIEEKINALTKTPNKKVVLIKKDPEYLDDYTEKFDEDEEFKKKQIFQIQWVFNESSRQQIDRR